MFNKPLGGTELMHNELIKRLPKSYLNTFSIFNYPSDADFSKKMIYWNQLSYDQDAVQFLSEPQNIERINHFVFVSNWQAEQFRKIFKIPGEKTSVIKNACIGVEKRTSIDNTKKIKICYTSTPWRGLDILLKAWEILNPENCELHVFSSCKIYGDDFSSSEDKKYEFLYDWCKRLPNVVYRGSVSNDKLRKELSDFDMLAYPSTFEETSCIAVIESLSAGLRVICSSIGALPETTEGWARVYSYVENRENHALIFAKTLEEEIELFRSGKLNQHLIQQVEVYSEKWNWNVRINDWTNLLDRINDSSDFIFRNNWDKTLYDEVYTNNEYELSDLNSDDVIIDIGCHIGSFTKLAFDKGSTKVYSYEADINNYDISKENLKNYNSNIFNLAVWRSDVNEDYISFLLDTNQDNTGIGTVMVESETKIKTISLDDILSQFDKVKFMKIDVEGSEYPILFTSKQITKVEEIVGEFHEYEDLNLIPENCRVPGYDKYTRNNIIDFFSNLGYNVEITEVNWSNSHGLFRAKKIK
jgi:FkbM family methyltransferase